MAKTFSAADVAAMDFDALPQTQDFPAMQFYPPEWLTGTATFAMTSEQRGVFIDLLAHAWNQKPPCSLPDDIAILSAYGRVTAARWGKIGVLLRAQFVRCTDGRLRNPKQVSVWMGMLDIREKRRTSRKGGTVVTTKDGVCDD